MYTPTKWQLRMFKFDRPGHVWLQTTREYPQKLSAKQAFQLAIAKWIQVVKERRAIVKRNQDQDREQLFFCGAGTTCALCEFSLRALANSNSIETKHHCTLFCPLAQAVGGIECTNTPYYRTRDNKTPKGRLNASISMLDLLQVIYAQIYPAG